MSRFSGVAAAGLAGSLIGNLQSGSCLSNPIAVDRCGGARLAHFSSLWRTDGDTKRGGTPILNDPRPEPLPAELAPFLVEARSQLEAETDGLPAHEAIQHLETTLAEAEAEATRLGLKLGAAAAPQATVTSDGENPVVVIQRMIDPTEVA